MTFSISSSHICKGRWSIKKPRFVSFFFLVPLIECRWNNMWLNLRLFYLSFIFYSAINYPRCIVWAARYWVHTVKILLLWIFLLKDLHPSSSTLRKNPIRKNVHHTRIRKPVNPKRVAISNPLPRHVHNHHLHLHTIRHTDRILLHPSRRVLRHLLLPHLTANARMNRLLASSLIPHRVPRTRRGANHLHYDLPRFVTKMIPFARALASKCSKLENFTIEQALSQTRIASIIKSNSISLMVRLFIKLYPFLSNIFAYYTSRDPLLFDM